MDLEKCCEMNSWFQRSVAIQPGTDPPKFDGRLWIELRRRPTLLEIDTKFQLSVSIVYLAFKVAFRTVVTKPVSGAMIRG